MVCLLACLYACMYVSVWVKMYARVCASLRAGSNESSYFILHVNVNNFGGIMLQLLPE